MLVVEAFLQKHHIKDSVIAVGVSGGADSLALVLMLAEELPTFGRRVVALTVDHHLRPTSTDEAAYVAKIMQQHGIEHHILDWTGEKPHANVEDVARQARYELLKNWCQAHQINCLCVAHHCQDQAETFLMRLQRGSGLQGLCAMREVSYQNGLKILRPLLHYNPQALRAYLRQKNIRWIEDESNTDKRYLRNKVRAFLPLLAQQIGISTDRICTAVQNLQSAEDFIETQTDTIFAAAVHDYFATVFYFNYSDFLAWHAEIQFRILARLCRQTYIPRAQRVLNLLEKMRHVPFGGATLGQKAIIWTDDIVYVVPEQREKLPFKAKEWQNFVAANPLYKNLKLPFAVRRTILNAVRKK